MLIDVLGKTFYAVFYGVIVHAIFHVGKSQDWRIVHGSIWLLQLCRFLKETHYFLELILRTLVVYAPSLIHDLEKHVIFVDHVIRTSATVLDCGGEANVRGRLRKDGGIELVISEATEDGLGGWNMGLIYFSLGSCIYRCLQMNFLWKKRDRKS